jgi:hypothetical protein
MIVTLVFFIRACLSDPEGTGAIAHTGAELGNVQKQESVSTVTPVQPYAQPQGQYPPQQPQPYQYGQQPQQPYGAPQQPYGQPQQPYGAPQQPYGAPQ